MGYGRDGGGNDLLLALKGQIDKLKTWISTQGFLTEESDPTVPAWAKADSKPTYTYSEVGAVQAAHDILTKVGDIYIIPDGADFNDYWNPGVWEVFSGSNAETMTNCPTTHGGGKLITVAATSTGAYSTQFYLTTYGELWRRYKRGSADTPSVWKRVFFQYGDSNTVSKNSSFGASTFQVYVYPYPHFAIVYFNISLPTLTAATTYTMCTIPASVITPARTCNFTVSGQAGNGYLLAINANGNFTVYSPSARSNIEFIRGTLTIPTTQ